LNSSTRKKSIAWSLLILWMAVIFFLSSQPGRESSESGKWLMDFFLSLGINLKAIFGTYTSYIIRKTAHFTEYFILTLLAHGAFRKYESLSRPLLFAFLFSVIYAATDELHQSFVPDRVATPVDVLIDCAGALLACGIIAWRLSKRSRSK
jgi:VanZ family protein